MKFPYGISDFYQLVTEGYFYVDRTDHVPQIEEAGKHLLFLRPRRFGKTLLLSMLENYYDVAKADEFETLFGQLAIGRNPTSRHNRYLVLKWDFSVVAADGEPAAIRQALHDHLNARMTIFARTYRHVLGEEIAFHPANAIATFESLMGVVKASGHPLYLLIDEYDNFANEVMMGSQPDSPKRYEALLAGEGSLKTVFKAVKSASAGLGLDRVFITGVSPVVMSDLTSGYNVARNVYLLPAFNDLCGFQEAEVAVALQQIVAECRLPASSADDALETMRTFYNGYCFSPSEEQLVYNPTLALYFMNYFREECRYPRQMLDSNLAMDRGKLAYVARLPGGGQVIMDAVNEAPPLNVRELADRFGVEDMLTVRKDPTFMCSVLYYFGVLTFGGQTQRGGLILRIPNLVVRRLYAEQIQTLLLPDPQAQQDGLAAAETFYATCDLQPLCDFIEQRYFRAFDNRDYRWANELTVKTAFLTLLFNDTFYIADSEAALERGYADLTLILRPEMRRYQLLDILIEFKYVALTDVRLTREQARSLSAVEVAALLPVQAKLAEAKDRLPGYRQTLVQRYGAALRLRTYAVVALGFDRLTWEEAPV